MANETIDKAFLGTGWSFPPEFSNRGKGAQMVADDEDICQSLNILFSTAPGERVMNPSYGCGLKALVFEHINESTVTEIKDVVERAVLFFEPRITLNLVEVDDADIYDGVIKIKLDYTVRTTNTRSNIVYPFYLLEGSNVRL
ncbi:MAG: GPW/gp25 family protein [Pseudomonadota bacterium]|nr:GPW/gp25 family protein [Pseudomonadota bacterium]